jgi:hypothetical protein
MSIFNAGGQAGQGLAQGQQVLKSMNEKGRNAFLFDWLLCSLACIVVFVAPAYAVLCFIAWDILLPDFNNKEHLVCLRFMGVFFLLGTAYLTNYLRNN